MNVKKCLVQYTETPTKYKKYRGQSPNLSLPVDSTLPLKSCKCKKNPNITWCYCFLKYTDIAQQKLFLEKNMYILWLFMIQASMVKTSMVKEGMEGSFRTGKFPK